MKRYLMFIFSILLFFGVLTVNAKSPTIDLEDVVKVINDGDISKEFLESKKNETDEDGKKVWKSVKLYSHTENGTLHINYEYEAEEEYYAGNIMANIASDGITLSSLIEFNDKDEYHYGREIEIHNLIPLWVLEASDSWDKIEGYIKDEASYITKLNTIFDRCYRKEMHICRTVNSSYGEHDYISDAELTEEPAKYIISKLKVEAEEKANDRLMAMLLIVAIILILIIGLMKASQPKRKVMKY